MSGRLGLDIGAIGIAGLCLWQAPLPARAETQPARLAVANLDYVDTSGEPVDQRSAHARRLEAFAEDLRNDLGNSGKLRVLALDCATPDCSASTTDPNKLVTAARQAGATYLLYGGVHKMSTLIQWAKVQILDIKTGQVVFDRLLSFRGDDDAAWKRAEEFLARDILTHDTLR